jgi:hypothetical protein
MNRSDLLDRLDKVTDRAASFAIQRGMPIPMSKKSVIIGAAVIEKNDCGFYDVMSVDKDMLYENISVFDVAVIIAQRYNRRESGVIKQVLTLEEKFSKYHNDMIHYLHCMKTAKKAKDAERMAILEDKFQLAEQKAKDTRDSISIFKSVK